MWQLSEPLSVHAPDLHQQIRHAGRSRSAVLGTAALLSHRPIDNEALVRAVEDAEQAQRQIEDAVEEMRAFLSGEFTFKDSFPRRRSVGGWSGEHGGRVAAGVRAEQVDEVGV
jgi:enamine deaminase RidA (YjgF/YER057c/UK114 family)